MKYKVFVDGQEGTTGLEIYSRLNKRDDIEVIRIDSDKRKDLNERERLVNEADIVFLCLPDDAARESVSLVRNDRVRIIDASTAHRTADGWAYGIPELSTWHRTAIKESKRVSVAGCFATGFTMLVRPLVDGGFIKPDCPITCHSVTGYSGGGRKLIEIYESSGKENTLRSPNFYALGLTHKHLPEMQKHGGLDKPPVFTPILGNYYRGMTVAVPLHSSLLAKNASALDIHKFYSEHFNGERFVKVMPFGIQNELEFGYLNAEGCNNTNNLEIYVFGHDKQVLIAARLDNLGKGASGAAVQNMNIMLGLDEGLGFDL